MAQRQVDRVRGHGARLISHAPDGKVETTYLAGRREWTYDNQPHNQP